WTAVLDRSERGLVALEFLVVDRDRVVRMIENLLEGPLVFLTSPNIEIDARVVAIAVKEKLSGLGGGDPELGVTGVCLTERDNFRKCVDLSPVLGSVAPVFRVALHDQPLTIQAVSVAQLLSDGTGKTILRDGARAAANRRQPVEAPADA